MARWLPPEYIEATFDRRWEGETMSNAPREITTPPEGYEWTGEFRPPLRGEPFGTWNPNLRRWLVGHYEVDEPETRQPILRKVKPPTVLVELPRGMVETIALHERGRLHIEGVRTPLVSERLTELADACRAALDKEEQE